MGGRFGARPAPPAPVTIALELAVADPPPRPLVPCDESRAVQAATTAIASDARMVRAEREVARKNRSGLTLRN